MNKRRVIVSQPARSDIREIAKYTRREWGNDQAGNYVKHLRRTIQSLTDFPEIGIEYEIGASMLMRTFFRHHVIYYQVGKSHVRVVRIIHERQDAGGILD